VRQANHQCTCQRKPLLIKQESVQNYHHWATVSWMSVQVNMCRHWECQY
jgi:hypothetical protein